MTACTHKVQYYETDKMGIVHHSNYIRWFEEARIDWLEQIGISFSEWESHGYASPVVNISCSYVLPMRFGDIGFITVTATKVTAAKLELSYIVENQEYQICCLGTSSHCFTASKGIPISFKREKPEYWNKLKTMEQPKEQD